MKLSEINLESMIMAYVEMMYIRGGPPGGGGAGGTVPPPLFQAPGKCPFLHRKSVPLTL